MSDDDIDASDIPPLTERFFASAVLRRGTGLGVELRLVVDPEVADWFRRLGTGWEGRANAALRLYAAAHATTAVAPSPTTAEAEVPSDARGREFDSAMMDIYKRAMTEAQYRAVRFHEMLIQHGGLGAAKRLLEGKAVSEGYTALALKGRLDLTVEAVIHDNPKWHHLFTPDELQEVVQRLVSFKYPPALAKRRPAG